MDETQKTSEKSRTSIGIKWVENANLEDVLDLAAGISKIADSGEYGTALLNIELLEGIQKDALYAAVAFGIASRYTGKESKEFRELADKVIGYCRKNSVYLR